MPSSRAPIVLALIPLACFIWQYACIVRGHATYCPGTFLDKLATFAYDVAVWAGKWVAVLSSFIDYIVNLIDWEDLKGAFVQLVNPIIRLIFSPTFGFIKSFVETAATYVDERLIYIGFGCLIVAICALLGYVAAHLDEWTRIESTIKTRKPNKTVMAGDYMTKQ